jgi:DNA-binding MarR family transcriptional regulator/GNAT superfamily N-acetyltransferase
VTNVQALSADARIERCSAAVRDFNRFYTRVIGLLQAGYLQTAYSLTEARVIFELAQCEALRRGADAAALRGSLDLDAGYLSRILARFDADGLITRARSRADGRRHTISLTDAGREAAALLNERADAQVKRLLTAVTDAEKARLTTAMAQIRQIIDRSQASRPGIVILRPPRPGELGWVIQRNGAIYAEEYGWDETYEALVARIVADYATSHDPRREAAWIAEVDGAPAGCVFCVRDSGDTAGTATARLRLLLVEPRARGMGIGARLVAECASFAKQAGYTDLVLWTNDVLVQARRIYEKAGFRLVKSERHRSFGHDLVGQTWHLPLA